MINWFSDLDIKLQIVLISSITSIGVLYLGGFLKEYMNDIH